MINFNLNKKYLLVLLVSSAFVFSTLYFSGNINNVGERTSNFWEASGGYIRTIGQSGYNILVNGTNKYINFGSTSGSSGYGIRDNGGNIELKDSGGNWLAPLSSSSAASLYVNRNDWTTIDNYPAACNSGDFVTAIGDTLTCNTPSGAGTVKSVGLVVPTGLTVSGVPITVSGTGTIAYDTGYSIPLTADTAKGVTAYGYGNHAGLYPTYAYATSSFVHRNDWTTIDSYPVACSANQYITTIGDTNTCSRPSFVTLSDYASSSPVSGDILSWNGSSWTNVPQGAVSAGAGANGYFDDATTTDSYGGILRSPNTVTPEQADSVTFTGVATTTFIEGYLYPTPQNRTSWNGGVWKFNMWAYVNDNDKVSELINAVYRVQTSTGTVSMSGTGVTRTATSSVPFFEAGDASSSPIVSSFIQTASGTLKIIGYTSATQVTVQTASGYVNESNVSYSVHRYKFQVSTSDINGAAVTLYSVTSLQPNYALDPSDTIAVRIYGRTTSTRNPITITFTHNGTLHYSYFETPFLQRHNDLASVQGLVGTEAYHLSLAQHTIATQSANSTLSGYLSNTDWNTFNNKVSNSYASSTFVTYSYASSTFPNETTSTIGALINGSTATTTPADTDRFAFSASSLLRHITWANIKDALKTYFDTLYAPKNIYPAFTTPATSTLPVATTTIAAGVAVVAETWTNISCFTNTGTSTVYFSDGTNNMNSLTATTTVSSATLSTNNSFTAGEKRYFNYGANTASTTVVSCTVTKNY